MTMLEALSFPSSEAFSLAGTSITLISSLLEVSGTSELLIKSVPPGTTMDWNLVREGRFITTRTSASLMSGQLIGRSETTTVQLAVPPLISGP